MQLQGFTVCWTNLRSWWQLRSRHRGLPEGSDLLVSQSWERWLGQVTVSIFQNILTGSTWRTERKFYRSQGKAQILALKNQLDPSTFELGRSWEIQVIYLRHIARDRAQRRGTTMSYGQWATALRPGAQVSWLPDQCSFCFPCYISTEWDAQCVCMLGGGNPPHQTDVVWHQLGILLFNSFWHSPEGTSDPTS